MVLEFYPTDPKKLFLEIASQLGVTPEGNTIKIPSHLGEGYSSQYPLEPGLTMSIINWKLREDLKFIRKPNPSKLFYPIIFWVDEEVQQKIKTEWKSIGPDSPFGIFFPSPEIESQYLAKKGKSVLNITVTLSKEWIEQFSKEDSKVYQMINSSKPFYIFETPTFEQKILLRSLIIENELNDLYLRGIALQLIAILFKEIEKRAFTSNLPLHSHDIEILFRVKQKIQADPINLSSLENISSEYGMSYGQFVSKFKMVFGITPKKFIQSCKMKIALDNLALKKTVSEVGYMVGYSNLSHFSQVFKAQYGVSPREYIKLI